MASVDDFLKQYETVDSFLSKYGDEAPLGDRISVALKQGFVGPGNTVDRAYTGLALGLDSMFNGPNAAGDKVYQDMQERIKQRNQWANPQNINPGVGPGVLGALANTPQNLLSFPLTAFETGQKFIEHGESLPTALGATGVQTGANAIAAALPAAMPGNLATRAVTGAGINAAQYGVTQSALEFLADYDSTKEEMAPTWEGAAKAAGIGAGIGAGLGRGNTPAPKLKPRVEPTAEAPKADVKEPEFYSPSQLKKYVEIQERYKQHFAEQEAAKQAAERQAAAQRAVDARQTDLELDVARKGTLDFNAAERARQENAPTGFEAYQEALRRDAEMRRPGNNEALPFESPYPVDANEFPQVLQDAPYKYEGGIDYTLPMEQKALPLDVMNILRPEPKAPDPFNRVSPMQNAKRMTEGSGLRLKGKSQHGGIDLDILVPKKFSDFVERWMSSGGNINYVSVARMLADMPTRLSKIQRNLLEEQFPETAKKYQEKIDRAVSNSDMEAAQRWGIRYDNALISDAVVKHFDAFGKGFKLEGETYAGTNGFNANRVKARVEADRILSIAKKQQGGIDLQEISEGITKLFKLSKPAVERLGDLPGMGKEGKDLIFVPESGYAVLDKIKSEADGPHLWTDFQSGLLHAGEKGASTLVKTTGQWLQYAHRMADWNIRNVVQPLEGAMTKLKSAEMVPLMELLKEEMFARAKSAPEELKARGLSDKQINVYNKLREAYSKALEAQNAGRAALGMEPITEQNAYLSSVFHGDYHVSVKDANGNIKWYIQQPTRSAANKAVKWLKANVEGLDISKVEHRPGLSYGEVPRDMLGAYQEMMKLFKDDPIAQQIQAVMEQWAQDRGAKFTRQDVHHTNNKANVRGFEGDQPWKSESKNAYDLAEAQMLYLKNAFRWAHMQEAVSQIKPMLADPDILANQPNNVEMSKAYLLNNTGVSKNLMKGIESYLAKGLGRSSNLAPSVVRDLKSVTYMMQLGLSPGYWIATPLQLVAGNLAWHTKLGLTSGNMLKDLSLSIMDGVAGISKEWIGDVAGKGIKKAIPMSKFGEEALKWAEANSTIATNLFDENAGLGEHKILAEAKNVVGWTIAKPEQFSRWVTFIGFARHLDSTGMFEGARDQMFQRAAELTDNVATDMHRWSRPLAVEKGGAVGEALYTYKAPVMNMLNNLSIFARDASKGNPGPLLAFLLATGVMGGVANIPLMNELELAMNQIKDFIAEHKPDWYEKVKGVSIKEAMLRNVPDSTTAGEIANWGLASTMTGMNMSSRFSQEVFDPTNPLSSIAPLGQEFKEWIGAGNVLLNPNRDTAAQAMWDNSPPLVKGLLENYNDSFKSGPMDRQGRQPVRNPSRVTNTDTMYKRTLKDREARNLGLTSLEEGKTRTKDYINNMETKRINTAQEKLLDKTINAVVRGAKEEAGNYMAKYYKLYGDDAQAQQYIESKILKMGLTPQEFRTVYANKLSEIDALKRRQELGK